MKSKKELRILISELEKDLFQYKQWLIGYKAKKESPSRNVLDGFNIVYNQLQILYSVLEEDFPNNDLYNAVI